MSKQKANRATRTIGFFLFWQHAIYAGIVGHWRRQSTKTFTFTTHRAIFGTVKRPGTDFHCTLPWSVVQ